MIALIIVIAVVVLVLGWLALTYNGLVRKRLRVDNSWSQIEVGLKQRNDLIPNVVNTVKGYAEHEKGVFEGVTEARAASVNAKTPQEVAGAENMMQQMLGKLFAVAEAYPDLKASTNFLELQGQLSDIEQKIAVSRQVYNDTVQTFNTAVQTFPTLLIAGPFGFKSREFFETPEAEQAVPNVSFAQ